MPYRKIEALTGVSHNTIIAWNKVHEDEDETSVMRSAEQSTATVRT
jgi:hypothetical protein